MAEESGILPLTAAFTVVLVILIFALPRRYVLTPFALAACFVPAEQHAYVFGLHFYVLRILILAGLVRIWVRSERRALRWNTFDKVLVAWVFYRAFAYILLRAQGQAVIYQSGQLLEVLGMYWITRQSIRSWDDVKRIMGAFAICSFIMAPLMVQEWITGSNAFAVLGRVYTNLREGDFRAQGSFPHAIIAGSFWACLVPFFIALGVTGRHKTLYWGAVGATVAIVLACHSSTPLGGLGAVLVLMALYKYRHYGRYMFWTLFGTVAGLHMVMTGPVWSLLTRIRIVGGSTGWHRYHLIDQTIKHFREWALLGTLSTAHWGYGLFDVTNQYCLEGVWGGLLTLVLFVAVLVVAVRTTARYSLKRISIEHRWLGWGLCTAVLGHCVMFIGVGYFGQILMLLYLTFGLVGSVYDWNARLVAPAPVGRVVMDRARPPAYPQFDAIR
jgi:hypothetical protein